MRILFLGNGPVACEVLKYLRDEAETDASAGNIHNYVQENVQKNAEENAKENAGAGAHPNAAWGNNAPNPDDADTIVGLVLHPDARARHSEELRALSGLPAAQIFDGSKLREAPTLAAIRDLQADIAISVFFGYILRPPFLDLFSQGVVNLHPSLLPHNRGANPNVWSIVDGTPSGVTLHYIDAGVDTGDIIAQRPVCALPTDTGKTLYARLEQACGMLFRDTWPRLRAGTAPRVMQQTGAGTTHRRSDLCALDCLDLDAPTTARQVLDLLRARTFAPYAGAYFEDDGQKIYLRLQLLTEAELQSE